MDRRERFAIPEETIRMALVALQARLWTALPGIVQSFNAAQMTVAVQPSINGRARQPDGTFADLAMPLLLDCPVLWMGGGGVTATFPIHPGNECLVIFASRCIDAWWSQGGVQGQNELRMHNLSDGFALVGLRSLPRAFTVDITSACLISDDQATFVKLNPTAKTVTATAQGGINLNGVTIDQAGNLSTPTTLHAAGNINSGATINAATDVTTTAGISLTSHVHPDPQGGTVGPAVG